MPTPIAMPMASHRPPVPRMSAAAAPMPIPRTTPKPICMDDADAGRFIFLAPHCPPVGGLICFFAVSSLNRAELFREMTPRPAPIAAPRATPTPMLIGFAVAIESPSDRKQARARRPRLHCLCLLLRAVAGQGWLVADLADLAEQFAQRHT